MTRGATELIQAQLAGMTDGTTAGEGSARTARAIKHGFLSIGHGMVGQREAALQSVGAASGETSSLSPGHMVQQQQQQQWQGCSQTPDMAVLRTMARALLAVKGEGSAPPTRLS